jgi:hypothetical protein
MYALMNADNTVASITGKNRGVEWGGAVIDNVDLLTPAERQKFRIWEVAEDSAAQPENPVEAGCDLIILPESYTVVRRKAWRSKTAEEVKGEAKAKAQADLDTSDKVVIRVLEDLIETLITKRVISKSDLPTKAVEKLDNRAALRQTLKDNG